GDGATKTVNVLTVGASNVHAFVGVGDPDSDHDGDFDSADNPSANHAIGLVVQDLDFGMAMLKPVAIADKSSYFALQANASGISLVGVPGVILSVTNLNVTVNSATVPATGGGTPTGPPPPVINFIQSF